MYVYARYMYMYAGHVNIYARYIYVYIYIYIYICAVNIYARYMHVYIYALYELIDSLRCIYPYLPPRCSLWKQLDAPRGILYDSIDNQLRYTSFIEPSTYS
jgi:hypothetical protein